MRNLFDTRAWMYRKMMEADGGGAAGGQGPDNAPGQGPDNAPGAGGDGNPPQGGGGEQNPTPPEARFTQADIDRIISTTIAKERQRAEKEIRKAKTEAERLASLSGEERAKEEFENRTKALEEREREITRRELKSQAVSELQQRNIPLELVDLLNLEDADKCQESITALSGAFEKALKKAVNERLKSAPPKASGAGNISADDYERMRQYAGLKPKK